jgi:hypothetical protein
MGAPQVILQWKTMRKSAEVLTENRNNISGSTATLQSGISDLRKGKKAKKQRNCRKY